MNVFKRTDILLPQNVEMERWAVIACDQFTSDKEYWKRVHLAGEGVPSTIHMILPEAELGITDEASAVAAINATMEQYLKDNIFRVYPDAYIYVERTLEDGSVRPGLLGAVDLEGYDYHPGSNSPIRATEQTVLERIPPRMAIRASAVYELPHVMLLIDDKNGLMKRIAARKKEFAAVYDFDLMLGGGHIAGSRITGDALADILAWIAEYEASVEGDLIYAVGDGNHSLASAKAFYEKLKTELGETAKDHPARYALVELTALQSRALDFEPIYRVVTDCDTADFLTELSKITGEKKRCAHTVRVITESEDKEISFLRKSHALTVGTLQNFIDDYMEKHPGVKCDYIHDEDALIDLAKRKNSVGFLFGGMKKNELFPYVQKNGTLPRKTFSMGEARSKRYYIEARKITK